MTALVALYISLVVLNNVLIPETNLNYVRHVMTMDTLSGADEHAWRAISAPWLHSVSFILIIILEGVSAVLCWLGIWRMLQNRHFEKGKAMATVGLTLALVIWFGVFFVLGGEWFLAWQTPWGALASAIRVITMAGFALVFLNLPEAQKIE